MTKEADGTLTLTLEDGASVGGFDQVLVAAGREPVLDTLGLDRIGVKTEKGYITVRREGGLKLHLYSQTHGRCGGIFLCSWNETSTISCGDVSRSDRSAATGCWFDGWEGGRAQGQNMPFFSKGHPLVDFCAGSPDCMRRVTR